MSGESFFVFLGIAAKGCCLAVTVKKWYLTMVLYLLHFTSNTISGKENLIFLYKQAENISEIMLLSYCLIEKRWCDLTSTACFSRLCIIFRTACGKHIKIASHEWTECLLHSNSLHCILPLTEPSSFSCGFQIPGISDLAVSDFISILGRTHPVEEIKGI